MRRASLVTVVTAAVLSFGFPHVALAAPAPVKLVDPPGVQLTPFRNATWVLYTSNTPAHPNHFDAYAQDLATKERVKLNTGGQGVAGGFDPTTVNDTAIYQQTGTAGSAIYSIDLVTMARTKVPGVNSPADDTDPRISTDYISFLRTFTQNKKHFIGVYLYDRSGGPAKRIAQYPATHYLTNGSLGDIYATWTDCSPVTCSAFVYDADTSSLKKVPTVKGRPQYAPSVDEGSGMLFFMRSGFACGVQVTFFEVPVATPGIAPTKIAQLPKGYDTDDEMSIWPDTVSGLDLQFIKVNCAAGTTGVYTLPGVT
ncbi:MAG TPA: hypothetical protein VK646_11865 [Actinomycetota bacterium]|nr:hypothetical protein [Actinomycetota bacterium]